MKKPEKTNVMRILEQKKVPYGSYSYVNTDALSGAEVAKALNQNPEQVFKTLVTIGHSKTNYVFLVPVEKELDLKKAAKAVGEKSIQMIPAKELLPLTGYVHGGCSPIGMKKQFPTYLHASATGFERITVSAGVRGAQLLLTVSDLLLFVEAKCVPLTVK